MSLGQAAGHGCGAFGDFKTLVAKIHGFPRQLQRAFPVVTPAAAAPFQSQHIRAGGGVSVHQHQIAAPAQAYPAGKGIGIRFPDGRAKVQMLQKAVIIDTEQVGIDIGLNVEYAVVLFDHKEPCLFIFSSILYGKKWCVNEIFGDGTGPV